MSPTGTAALSFLPSADGRPFADTAAQPVEAMSARPLLFLPSAEGKPSADTAAQPLEAALRPRRAWRSGRLRRPGIAVPTAGAKGDRTPYGFLSPLDSPKPSFAPRRPSVARRNGSYGGLGSVRRAAFGTLYCPEFTLRDWQRCQCAARRCRALDLCCDRLRFDQGCTPGSTNAPVGPSLLDARPKGVAS